MVDTTVQPKAIAHPTDARLCHRALEELVDLAERNGAFPGPRPGSMRGASVLPQKSAQSPSSIGFETNPVMSNTPPGCFSRFIACERGAIPRDPGSPFLSLRRGNFSLLGMTLFLAMVRSGIQVLSRENLPGDGFDRDWPLRH